MVAPFDRRARIRSTLDLESLGFLSGEMKEIKTSRAATATRNEDEITSVALDRPKDLLLF